MKTSNTFRCSLPEVVRAGSLNGVRVGAGPGVGPEGWPKWSAHPFGGGCAGGRHSTLLLFQALQKWHLGSFGLFVSCCS